MTDLTEWLLRTLPSEAGPACSWLAAHWDGTRSALLALCLGILAAELAAVRWLAE